MFYLKCKIVSTCDFIQYSTTINLETFQLIYVTRVTCTGSVLDQTSTVTKLLCPRLLLLRC